MANKILVQQLRSKLTYDTGNAKLPNSTDFNENTQYKYGTLALNYLKGQEAMTTLNDENQVVAFNYNLNLTSNSTTVEEQVYEIVKTAKSITVNNEWLITHRIINEGIITLLGGCFNENKIEYIKVVINEDRKCTKEVSNFEFNFGADDIDFQYNMSNQNVTNVGDALRELYQEINDIITNPIRFVEGNGIVVSGEGTEKTISTNVKLDINTVDGKEMIQLLDATDNSKVLAEVDASKFVVDGMLNSAEIISVTDETELPEGVELPNGKYIKLTWNTDAVKTDTYIPVAGLISEHKVVAGEDVAGEMVIVATNVVESTNEKGIKVSTVTVSVDDSGVKTALDTKIGKDDVVLSIANYRRDFTLFNTEPLVVTERRWTGVIDSVDVVLPLHLELCNGNDEVLWSTTDDTTVKVSFQTISNELRIIKHPNDNGLNIVTEYISLVDGEVIKIKNLSEMHVLGYIIILEETKFTTEESIQYLESNKIDNATFKLSLESKADNNVIQQLENEKANKTEVESALTNVNNILNTKIGHSDIILTTNIVHSSVVVDSSNNYYSFSMQNSMELYIESKTRIAAPETNTEDLLEVYGKDSGQKFYSLPIDKNSRIVRTSNELQHYTMNDGKWVLNNSVETYELDFYLTYTNNGKNLTFTVSLLNVNNLNVENAIKYLEDTKANKSEVENDLNECINKSHTHMNQEILNNLTSSEISKWDNYDNTLKLNITSSNTEEGDIKFTKYNFYQGDINETNNIGSINVPVDLVIKDGRIINATEEDKGIDSDVIVGDKYLKVELNSTTAKPIYIPVKELMDVYTSDEVYIKEEKNKFSLDFNQLDLDLIQTTTNVGSILSQHFNAIEETKTLAQQAIDTIPTKTSELTNDSDFITKTYVDNEINGISNSLNNTITSINEEIENIQNDIIDNEEVIAVTLHNIKDSIGLTKNGQFVIDDKEQSVKTYLEKTSNKIQETQNLINKQEDTLLKTVKLASYNSSLDVEPFKDVVNKFNFKSIYFDGNNYPDDSDAYGVPFELPSVLNFNEYHYIIYNSNNNISCLLSFPQMHSYDGRDCNVVCLNGDNITIGPESYAEINVVSCVDINYGITQIFIRAIV